METFFFSSTLLVPFPKADSDYTFCWLGTINSERNKVEVIVFNTDNTCQFKPILEKYLAKLMLMRRRGSIKIGQLKFANEPIEKELMQMQRIKNQIRFIKRTLFEMATSIYVKHPVQPLLDIVAQNLHIKLTPQDVIYTSGVSRVEKG